MRFPYGLSNDFPTIPCLVFLLTGKRITNFGTTIPEVKVQPPDCPLRQRCVLVKHFCDVADERIFRFSGFLPVTSKSEQQLTVYGKVQHDGIRRDLCLDGRALLCYDHDVVIKGLVSLDLIIRKRDEVLRANASQKKCPADHLVGDAPVVGQGAVIRQAQIPPLLIAHQGHVIPERIDGLDVSAHERLHSLQRIGDFPHLARLHRLHY